MVKTGVWFLRWYETIECYTYVGMSVRIFPLDINQKPAIILPFWSQFSWPSSLKFWIDGIRVVKFSAMANEIPNSTEQQMLGSMFLGTAIAIM